jgi:hypothetical protein
MYEYKAVSARMEVGSINVLQASLDRYSRDGWRLVQTLADCGTTSCLIFERRIERELVSNDFPSAF